MTNTAATLAEQIACLHLSAQAEGAAARARNDLVSALLFATLAALVGQLLPLLRRHRAAWPVIVPQGLLPHCPYAVPHNMPGPRAARHRGPVPPRAQRLGRVPTWWARNRGARSIPRHAPELRPAKPARAPPAPQP